MTPAYAWALAFVAAWLAAYLALRRVRSPRLTVYPFLVIYRIGYSRPAMGAGPGLRAARLYGYASIPAAAVAIGLFYYLSVTAFVHRYVAPAPYAAEEGFVPLIPGVTVTLGELVYILLAVGVAVLVHELSHAVVARAEGVPVRDAGFLLLAFIPAAFVEPDEERFRSSPLLSRMKVYAVGVAANLALGLLFMLAFDLLAPRLADGIAIVSVVGGSPAAAAGLEAGMRIVAINGTPVTTVAQGLELLRRLGAENASVAAVIGLTVAYKGRLLDVVVHKWAGASMLGVEVVQSFSNGWLVSLVSSMYVVNLGLALINAAPFAFPIPGFGIETDGGQAVREALSRLGRAGRSAAAAIELATLLLILSLITIAPIRLP